MIDVQPFTNYYGMIPGYLAKLYPKYQETVIDLPKFCHNKNKKHGNLRFLNDGVTDIDIKNQVISVMEDPETIEYDILSIDIGSASKSLDDIPGAFDYAIPTRPVHDMIARLKGAEVEFSKNECKEIRLVVVGGGASGIEVALSLVGRWSSMVRDDQELHVTLVTSDSILLPETPSVKAHCDSFLHE